MKLSALYILYCISLLFVFFVIHCSGDVDYSNSYEHPSACTGEENVVYVNASDGNDLSNPGTKEKPLRTIQAGIDCAASVFTKGEVHVAEGVYNVSGSISSPGQEKAGIVLAEGVSIYGGYEHGNWDSRDPSLHYSVIKDNTRSKTGYIDKPNRAIHAGNGITPDTLIDGFRINGGGGNYSSAITCDYGSPTILNCTINGGTATTAVGIWISGSSPVIKDNTINGGSTEGSTYGLYCEHAGATISNNSISGGAGQFESAGIETNYSNDRILANTINGGSSDRASTGILIIGDSPFIINNVINGQGSSSVISTWGIVFLSSTGASNPTIANNTIYGGNGTNNSCGIENQSSNPTLINNIIISNKGDSRSGIFDGTVGWAPASIENNDVYVVSSTEWDLFYDYDTEISYTEICSGNFGTTGCGHVLANPMGVQNITVDPLLNTSYMLTSSSPASVRQGGKDLSSLFTTDRNGNIRTDPWSMGAYEQD